MAAALACIHTPLPVRGKDVDLLLHLVSDYGLLLVFAWVLIEQLGMPIPAFPVLLIAGSLAARGALSMPGLVVASVAACLIADYAWYLAGRRYGTRVLRLICRLSLTPDVCVTQTQTLFDRWGAGSLVVAKFVPGFASIATAMAGACRISPRVFLACDAIGALLWAGTALAIGWTFSSALERVLGMLQHLGRWGVALLVGLLVAYLARKAWAHISRRRQMRMPRIAVNELKRRLRSNQPPIVLDVRKPALWQMERIANAWSLDSAQWRRLPPDTPIVVYCDCPQEASAIIIARQLRQAGFLQVRPLAGGLEAWRQAGGWLDTPRPCARLGC